MRTKEEVIKSAWGKYWESAKDYINEHGWISYKGMCNVFGDGKHPHLYFYQEIVKELCLEGCDEIVTYRPESISGIEDNRGWIKIESKEDLPKEGHLFWVMKKGYDYPLSEAMFNDDGEYWLSCCTHYKPFVKPKPPLY